MDVLPAVLSRSNTGDPPEDTRKVRRVAVAQPLCDIFHFHPRGLQHLAGSTETCVSQQLGIVGTHVRECSLQRAFAGITNGGSEFQAQIGLLNIGQHKLLERVDKIVWQGIIVER